MIILKSPSISIEEQNLVMRVTKNETQSGDTTAEIVRK